MFVQISDIPEYDTLAETPKCNGLVNLLIEFFYFTLFISTKMLSKNLLKMKGLRMKGKEVLKNQIVLGPRIYLM